MPRAADVAPHDYLPELLPVFRGLHLGLGAGHRGRGRDSRRRLCRGAVAWSLPLPWPPPRRAAPRRPMRSRTLPRRSLPSGSAAKHQEQGWQPPAVDRGSCYLPLRPPPRQVALRGRSQRCRRPLRRRTPPGRCHGLITGSAAKCRMGTLRGVRDATSSSCHVSGHHLLAGCWCLREEASGTPRGPNGCRGACSCRDVHSACEIPVPLPTGWDVQAGASRARAGAWS